MFIKTALLRALIQCMAILIMSLTLMSVSAPRVLAQTPDIAVTATIVTPAGEFSGTATFHGSGNADATTGNFSGPAATPPGTYTWQKDGSNFKVYKNGVLLWIFVGVRNTANTAGTVEAAGTSGGGGGWTR